MGLIAQIQSEPKKGKNKLQVVEEDEDDDLDGDAPEGPITVTMVDDVEISHRKEDDRSQQQKELDEEAEARRERWKEARENKKEFFLDDPEQAVKMFFSSHWRDKGYVQYAYSLLFCVRC